MSCWFKHTWLECGSRKLKSEGSLTGHPRSRDVIASVEKCKKCGDKRGFIHFYWYMQDANSDYKEVDFEYAEGLIDGTVKFD